jgi:hypothetical protein
MEQLANIFQSIWDIVLNVGDLFVQLLVLAMHGSLLIAWVAWWLWGVNWAKTWPVLARGAWVPLVLLMFVGAQVWSHIAPSELNLVIATIPNFWWQLLAVGLLLGVALFCGWLQGICHWEPPEITFDPPKFDPSHGNAIGHH